MTAISHRAGGRRRPARSNSRLRPRSAGQTYRINRKLAEAGHYPAIDIGQSISRCMNQVTSPEHQQSARAMKQNYAAYMEIKPLIPLGGLRAGATPASTKR